ncbi:hypothetical protein ACFPM0_02715 [Pseudonocardia sulfidoxydans]|uniref:hypothetical protein n=1 Tax=Pseudonocardia sulfidoxydans TaxID=54011 RepID=UPI0036140ABC
MRRPTRSVTEERTSPTGAAPGPRYVHDAEARRMTSRGADDEQAMVETPVLVERTPCAAG